MTRLIPSVTCCPIPPTALVERRERSGSHLPRRSGLGFPARFFVPFVMKKARAREKARPIHPAFNSHSLRLSSFDLDFGLPLLGPTPINRQIKKMIPAGIIRPMTTRTPVETFSFETNGKEMFGSVRLKGLLFGAMDEMPAPTAAMILCNVSLVSWIQPDWNWLSSHYDDPVKYIRER